MRELVSAKIALVPVGIVGVGRTHNGLGPFLAEFLEQEGFFVAGVSTALLFVGWLAFYFLLFMPRGSVG